jgi:hypothetical protein
MPNSRSRACKASAGVPKVPYTGITRASFMLQQSLRYLRDDEELAE